MHHATTWGILVHMQPTRVIRPARVTAPATTTAEQWTEGIGAGYCVDMAQRADGKTPNRVVRIDNDTWSAYARVCEARGISRADDLRMYIKRQIAEFEREQRRIARESTVLTTD